MGELKDKKVLVTGGASGLGRAYVETFRSQGAHVVYGDLKDPGDLDGYIQCDVTSWDAQLKLFEKAVAQLGRLDVVIANAGIGGAEEFSEFEDVSASPPTRPRTLVIDVNFTGVLYTAKLGMHQFAKQQSEGKNDASFQPIVVLGGSLASYMDFPLATVYCATKFGVRGLLNAMRHTAPRIKARVGLIAPWHVDTPMLAELAPVLKKMDIYIGPQEHVVSAVQDLIIDQSSNGRAYAAAVPNDISPKGYIDVEDFMQNRSLFERYTKQLVSEDAEIRPLPKYMS